MRLPSSSSLLLASLAVSSSSSSSSSLSALAAPVGDGTESLSSPAPVPPPTVPPHASISHGSDDTIVQPNGAPTSCAITFLSNTATDYLQATNLLDTVVDLLPPPIPGLIHSIVDPLIGGKGTPKAREVPLYVVDHLAPAGKTLRGEEAGGRGEHVVSEDSSMQPFASQPEASAPPAAGGEDAPVAPPHPPAPSLPTPRSGPVRRQAPQASNGQSEGNSPAPRPDLPSSPPKPSCPGVHAPVSNENENGLGGGHC